jgi:hypothetical protein
MTIVIKNSFCPALKVRQMGLGPYSESGQLYKSGMDE